MVWWVYTSVNLVTQCIIWLEFWESIKGLRFGSNKTISMHYFQCFLCRKAKSVSTVANQSDSESQKARSQVDIFVMWLRYLCHLLWHHLHQTTKHWNTFVAHCISVYCLNLKLYIYAELSLIYSLYYLFRLKKIKIYNIKSQYTGQTQIRAGHRYTHEKYLWVQVQVTCKHPWHGCVTGTGNSE